MRSPALRSDTSKKDATELTTPARPARPTRKKVSLIGGKAPTQALAVIASTADLLVAVFARHRP